MSPAIEPPRVSVILPVRNAEGTLASAIESIVGQTFSDWELLIADDGSSDPSARIADGFARTDPRIRVLRLPATGIVAALNQAITIAQGGLIARMDADDTSRPNRLARQVTFLAENPAIGVASCLVEFGGDDRTGRGYATHVAWLNSVRSSSEIARARFIESPVAHPSVLFRRELLEAHGSYREGDFPEDYELWLRWMDAGICFGKVEEVLLDWNDPPGRLSRTDPRYSINAFYRIKCDHLARWLEQNLVSTRPLWLWGAGRITRKRFRALEQIRGAFAGFIDIHPGKVGGEIHGRPIVAPDAIPPEAFVLAGVGSRGAREATTRILDSQDRKEGKDYLCVA